MSKPDVIHLWNPLISFTRFYGIIPLRRTNQEPYFERCTGSACWCLFLAAIYCFTLIIAILVFKDTFHRPSTVIVEASQFIIYYSHNEFTLIFFFVRSRDLPKLFQLWIDTERDLSQRGIRLSRLTKIQCYFIFLATIIICTVENMAYILSRVIGQDVDSLGDLLLTLAGKGTDICKYFGKYKHVYSVLLIFVETTSEVAWITGDFIIAFISIILHGYYSALEKQLKMENASSWSDLVELRRMHLKISKLALAIGEFFSPLILFAVGLDLIYILAFLYSGIEEDMSSSSILVRIIFTYTFIYLVLRLTFSTYLASRLAEMPMKIVDCLFTRPSLCGTNTDQQKRLLIQMDLLVQQINCNPISLGGGGFFVLSKASASALFSLIVTYEVIMLQLPR